MKLCETLIQENMESWLASADLPFLDDMVHDRLDHKKFVRYLIQDTQYLASFAKIYAWSFVKTDQLDVMRRLYEEMGIIVAGETDSHVTYLKDEGIDPEMVMEEETTEACSEYIDCMLKAAKEGTLAEGIFAAGPCNFSYYYIGLELKRRMEALGNYETNYFRPWLDYYISPAYKAGCDHFHELCDMVSQDLSAEEEESIRTVFRQCSDYERDFWIMAYQEQEE
ncbi:MAG: hypothetical protein PUB22_02890 [Clostridiales bacterium]|nr:hypothetical protein [Clostridiales bacterium]